MQLFEDYRYCGVLAVLVLLFLAERHFPLRHLRKPLLRRLFVNGCMSLLTLITALALVRPTVLSTLAWTDKNEFGFLFLFSLPGWIEGILGFLLLDLSFYYWHRMNHQISFLWRFHNVHHFDPDMDVSTGFRFHFVEVVFSVLFRALQMVTLGITLPVFLLYEFSFQTVTYFHHSNLRLYGKFDRFLNLFMVTPCMHGVHHSNYHNETNSNYSVICSLWDRLHRTFDDDTPQSNILIGVPGYSQDQDNRLGNALFAPFLRQKDYWKNRHTRQHSAGGHSKAKTTNAGSRQKNM